MNLSEPTPGVVEPDRPALVVGTGRSGTTMFFDCLGAHPDLGWPSQYLNRIPHAAPLAALSRVADLSDATRRWVNPSHERGSSRGRFWPGPSEAVLLWRNWCGDRFAFDFLLGERPSEEEAREVRWRIARILRWQGKSRYAAKFSGPLRVGYLSALLPKARFLHLVRDPRAVVNSLLKVDFWRHSHRVSEPAWHNGLSDDDLERWEESGRSPVALAALQWKAVVGLGRAEAEELAPGRYSELRYEDLVATPHEAMREALRFFELTPCAHIDDILDRRIPPRDMNVKWQHDLASTEIDLIEDLTGDLMASLSYRRA